MKITVTTDEFNTLHYFLDRECKRVAREYQDRSKRRHEYSTPTLLAAHFKAPHSGATPELDIHVNRRQLLYLRDLCDTHAKLARENVVPGYEKRIAEAPEEEKPRLQEALDRSWRVIELVRALRSKLERKL